MTRALLILRRDLRLALRQGSDSLAAVMFFVMAVALFPFGVGPEPNMLARVGSGILWVIALMASMLALERLFQNDYDDGSLELLALAPLPLEAVVIAKVAAHWIATALPLVAVAPLLALLLNTPVEILPPLVLALLLGTPTVSLLGAVGAALILGSRRGGVLVSLIVLPLAIPVLIFGVGAVEASLMSVSAQPYFLILLAFLLAAIPLCPWATAAAVRQALE